jgi:hypothetical protein
MVSVLVSAPAAVVRVACDTPGGTMIGTLARPVASAWMGPKSRSPTRSITLALGVVVMG